MRKLFISDIHGCYNEMKALFDHAAFNPVVDQLVVGGDMVNRGPDSALVLRELKSLQERYPQNVIVLSGNHEDMIGMYVAGVNMMWHDFNKESIKSFDEEFDDREFDTHMKWAISRPFLHEDDEYVYVHAGIDPRFPLSQQNRAACLWMPYLKNSPIRFDQFAPHDISDITNGKKVVYGHIPKPYIFDDGVRICCDLGASVFDEGPKLALVDLTNDHYWYYDFEKQTIAKRKIARKKAVA